MIRLEHTCVCVFLLCHIAEAHLQKAIWVLLSFSLFLLQPLACWSTAAQHGSPQHTLQGLSARTQYKLKPHRLWCPWVETFCCIWKHNHPQTAHPPPCPDGLLLDIPLLSMEVCFCKPSPRFKPPLRTTSHISLTSGLDGQANSWINNEKSIITHKFDFFNLVSNDFEFFSHNYDLLCHNFDFLWSTKAWFFSLCGRNWVLSSSRIERSK